MEGLGELEAEKEPTLSLMSAILLVVSSELSIGFGPSEEGPLLLGSSPAPSPWSPPVSNTRTKELVLSLVLIGFRRGSGGRVEQTLIAGL